MVPGGAGGMFGPASHVQPSFKMAMGGRIRERVTLESWDCAQSHSYLSN